MLPVRCQDASFCRLFFPFFFPSSTTRSSWAEHYVADERKEGPRGRSICLNHLWNGVDHHRATISHLVASRFVLFLSLVDSDRSWAGGTLAENIANRPDWIILWPGLEATGHKGTAAKRKYRGRVGSSQEFLPPSVHKDRQDLERIFWKIIWKILIN